MNFRRFLNVDADIQTSSCSPQIIRFCRKEQHNFSTYCSIFIKVRPNSKGSTDALKLLLWISPSSVRIFRGRRSTKRLDRFRKCVSEWSGGKGGSTRLQGEDFSEPWTSFVISSFIQFSSLPRGWVVGLFGRERTSLCLFLVTIKFVLPCIIYIMQPDRRTTNNYKQNNKTNPYQGQKETKLNRRASNIAEKGAKKIADDILSLKMQICNKRKLLFAIENNHPQGLALRWRISKQEDQCWRLECNSLIIHFD